MEGEGKGGVEATVESEVEAEHELHLCYWDTTSVVKPYKKE